MKPLDSVRVSDLLAQALENAREDPSRDSESRWELVRELHRRGGKLAFEQSVAWCGSPDPLVRSLGVDVLGQLGYTDGYPFKVEATPVLTALLHDAADEVVSCALIALGHLSSGEAASIAALASHASEDVRYSVAWSLGARNEPIARRTLIALSSDSDPDVRDWATFGLGTLSEVDNEDIRLALVARLDDQDSGVRGEAIRGLAVRHDPRLEEAIVQELTRPDCSDLAFEAASELKSERLLSRLEALGREHPDLEHVRIAIDVCRHAIRAE